MGKVVARLSAPLRREYKTADESFSIVVQPGGPGRRRGLPHELSMSAKREFLDWQRPALLAAVAYLRRRYSSVPTEAASPSIAAPQPIPRSNSRGKRRPAPKYPLQQGFLFPEEPLPTRENGEVPQFVEAAPPTPSSLEATHDSTMPATWDMQRVIVVVPGRRAGRRLLELLAFEARDHGLAMVPPTITTEGRLPELLYSPKHPFAESLTQDLAWSHALRQLQPAQLPAIVPHPPTADDVEAWRRLGEVLRQRHTELAADTLTFEDVVTQGRKLAKFPDAARWEAMHAAQQIYLHTLDNLQLWDIQTARLKAIEFEEITTEHDLVLLGTVDLNRTLRRMLDRIASRVTALINAPPSLAERFDAYGCVIPERWVGCEIPIADDQLRRVNGAADQADAVADILASYAGQFRGDQITIGVPDEKLVPHLQRQLEQNGVPVRWVVGTTLPATAPFRLLEAISELLGSESTKAFAALVRHPDIFQRLTTGAPEERVEFALLEELDSLQADYLVTRIPPARWPAEVRRQLERQENFTNLARAITVIDKLTAALRKEPLPLSQWSQPILDLLQTMYGERAEEEHTVAALGKIRDCLQIHAMLPTPLDPILSAAEAIRWSLDQLRGETIPPPTNEEAVELLGWLELPLDDAPALIVTSLNEGFAPTSTAGDSFLPNSLRKSLGLLDDDRQYARDAYAASAMLAAKQSVHFISARRDSEENPLIPSRLLFAAPAEQVVQRSRTFFQPLPETPPRLPLVGAGIMAPERSQLFVPRPRGEIEIPSRLRVTQFKDYLACPYRFYLKNILGLQGPSEPGEELAANAFGNLLHQVLERFGAHAEMRDSESCDDIYAFLDEELRVCAGIRYGNSNRLAAVEIQMEQMRNRLKYFADWQADQRRAGWQIVHSEVTEEPAQESESTEPPPPETKRSSRRNTPRPGDAEINIDGQPFFLGGRIDRIDQNEYGDLRIYDYKTGDRGEKPERAHRRRKNGGHEWIDLQLPLYRYLAAEMGLEGSMQLGYIVIPKVLENVKDELADWKAEELAEADETMRNVVRSIRQGIFWPPNSAPQYEDEFSPLCQDHRLGGRRYEEATP